MRFHQLSHIIQIAIDPHADVFSSLFGVSHQNFQWNSNFKRFHGLPCPGGVTESVTRDCADMCERYSGLGAFGKGLGAVNVKLSSDTWPGEDFCSSTAQLLPQYFVGQGGKGAAEEGVSAAWKQLVDDGLVEQECTCDCLRSCECLYPEVTPATSGTGEFVALEAVRDYSSVADVIGEGKDHRKTYSIGLPAGTPPPSSCDLCGDLTDTCASYAGGKRRGLQVSNTKEEFCCNPMYCEDYWYDCDGDSVDIIDSIAMAYIVHPWAAEHGWAACCAGRYNKAEFTYA